MKKRYLLGAGLAVAALAACAPTGLDSGFGTNGVLVRGLSADTNDRFLSVADGPNGTVYAGGYTTLAGGDQAFAVAQLDHDGNLVPTFGTGGIAVANVAVGTTGEVGRTVAVQADGKIVLGGVAEHVGGDARDRDGAVVRFNANGTPDATFGTGGTAIVDYGTGRVASATNPAFLVDAAWGLGSLPDGRVVLWGTTPSAAGTDSDFVLAGLTNTGGIDATFGTSGFTKFDGVTGLSTADNARNVLVQPDGKIVAIGYAIPPLTGVTQPIILRVSSNGTPDATFGTGGVATANVLPGVAEAYGIRQHLGGYVLAGYGNSGGTDTNVDQIIYRFSNSGVWDQTFGNAGVVRVDIAGLGLADRSRNIEVLPDNRILIPGTATVTPADTTVTPTIPANVNGLITLLSPTGAFDGYFGTGGKVVSDLGGPNDAWFGVTYSAEDSTIWVAGYKGIAGTVSATNNDDAAIARIDLNK